MNHPPTRREFLAYTAASAVTLAAEAHPRSVENDKPAPSPFVFALNTSTLAGQNLPIDKELDIAAGAGFVAVEPWLREVVKFESAGGKPEDLRKKSADLGLTFPSAIGFAKWIADDDAERAKGLEEAKRDMDRVARMGGTRIACPPAGAGGPIDLAKIAERYAAVIELGKSMGIACELEFWGPSKTLSTLDQALEIVRLCKQSDACVLADVYHLYKGGSDLGLLKGLPAGRIPVLHFNDYPADPSREKITDAHRIYPGVGIAPLGRILNDLRAAGGTTVLSLELFNREYWKRSPVAVAKEGFERMKAVVERAG